MNVEFNDNIATFVFSNRLHLLFTILFKLLFELMFDHLSSSESIIKNEIFFLFVTKNFFVSTTISIELMLSRVMNKVFLEFFLKVFAKLTFCNNFFHFILDEIKDFFEIFRNRFCIMIAHFKK